MIPDVLQKERAEAAKKLAEVEAEVARFEALKQLYPDLKRYEGRWKKVAYCSSSVNPKVDQYETRHNCGCCNDSPLELWPYIETAHGRVYSDPTGIFIGERDPFFYGDVSRAGWREQLQGYGFPEPLINNVAQMFRDERQKALDAVEERYSEDGKPDDEPDPLL